MPINNGKNAHFSLLVLIKNQRHDYQVHLLDPKPKTIFGASEIMNIPKYFTQDSFDENSPTEFSTKVVKIHAVGAQSFFNQTDCGHWVTTFMHKIIQHLKTTGEDDAVIQNVIPTLLKKYQENKAEHFLARRHLIYGLIALVLGMALIGAMGHIGTTMIVGLMSMCFTYAIYNTTQCIRLESMAVRPNINDLQRLSDLNMTGRKAVHPDAQETVLPTAPIIPAWCPPCPELQQGW